MYRDQCGKFVYGYRGLIHGIMELWLADLLGKGEI